MKAIKRISAILLAILLIASLSSTAFAATTYTPVPGTSTTFTKYLILDAGDNVPNVTFSFTIAAGEAISADTSDNAVMQVLPGVVVKNTETGAVTAPTVSTVTFAPSDETSTTTTGKIDLLRAASARATGLTAATGVQFEEGEKYAVQTATVNLSGVSFDEPGIYRYIIIETASATDEAAGIMHDNDVDRVLDVYVTDDGNGALVVSEYVLHTDVSNVAIGENMGSDDVATDGAALSDKTDGFTNEYNTKDLVFKKGVFGNQASRDKWFEFTAKVENIADADVFTVSLADDSNANTTDGNADGTSGTTASTRESNRSKTNPTSLTGAQLKAGVKFYLQHGQSIAIRGIAPNATYTITEDREDYKSTAAAVEGYADATTGVIGTIADGHGPDGNTKVVMTSYLNTRGGVVPTGVMLTVVPGVAIVAIALVGLFVLKRKKEEA